MSIDEKAFAKAAEAVTDFRSRNGAHFSWCNFQIFIEAYEQAKESKQPPLAGLKHDNPNHPRGVGFNEGVDAAISLLESKQPSIEPNGAMISNNNGLDAESLPNTPKQPSISEGDAIYSAGCILAKRIKPWLEARDAAEEIITALKPYLNITEE